MAQGLVLSKCNDSSLVIVSAQDGKGEKRSWSAQRLISVNARHSDSSVITISVAPAVLHADEPDNLAIS